MEYFSPKTISEAFALMRRWKGKAKVIAGGTNVIPEIRAKFLKKKILVDFNHLKTLSYIKEEKKRIRIGGLTTIAEIASSEVVQKYGPVLSGAAHQLGNPLVRNRATIAGNLADASPAADTAVPLLALEAMIVTDRDGGKGRQIPIDQFFLGPNRTVLKHDEMIREIFFSKIDPDSKMAYIKLGLRNAMAISVVSIAVLLEIDKDHCQKARVSLGAVAPKPIRAYEIEEMLVNQAISQELIKACCAKVEKEINPISDIRASADYRRSMTSILLKRALQQIILQGIM